MTTAEIVVVIACSAIGYWIVATFLKGKASPPRSNPNTQRDIATQAAAETTHEGGDKFSAGNFGETKENRPAIPTIQERETEKRRGERANYFVRHWRGQFSLGVSYWVNGALIAGALSDSRGINQ